MKLRNTAATSLLALSGLGLWVYASAKLAAGGDFNYRPNPLGVKMSPYGQVIALAVQGGIDADWHGTPEVGEAHVCSACGHDHGPQGRDQCSPGPGRGAKAAGGWLAKLELAATERTNGRPPTPGHKFYLRRQAENKLRMAWELDPSNYANYNSYHLFLTEPKVGTRPILTDKTIELSRLTIKYSLSQKGDPMAALTAASAASNILELMFLHRENYTTAQMQEQMAVLDHALEKTREYKELWEKSGNFERISEIRAQDMQQRLDFITKMRDVCEKTLRRLSDPGREISSKF